MNKSLVWLFLVTLLLSVNSVGYGQSYPPSLPDEEVYQVVEQMPEFPGGIATLAKFLQQNLELKKRTEATLIEGKIVISFVVDPTGQAINYKVIKGESLMEASTVEKMFQRMPLWKPGYQFGKPVAVQYTLPIFLEVDH